jgi:hypothetical protein
VSSPKNRFFDRFTLFSKKQFKPFIKHLRLILQLAQIMPDEKYPIEKITQVPDDSL